VCRWGSNERICVRRVNDTGVILATMHVDVKYIASPQAQITLSIKLKYMEKELLQKALDSILHGSTQIVTTTDSYGQTTTQQIRINDLRIDLVNKLAEKLVQTDEFKKAIVSIFTSDVVKKIQDGLISNFKISDLDYRVQSDLKEKVTKDIKANFEIKQFKVTAEAIIKD
jgi:ribosomal protein S13